MSAKNVSFFGWLPYEHIIMTPLINNQINYTRCKRYKIMLRGECVLCIPSIQDHRGQVLPTKNQKMNAGDISRRGY